MLSKNPRSIYDKTRLLENVLQAEITRYFPKSQVKCKTILKIVSKFFATKMDQKFFKIVLINAAKYQKLYEPIYFPSSSPLVQNNFNFIREKMIMKNQKLSGNFPHSI